MSQRFLVCGNHPTLLATRKLVLEHAGLCVEAVLGVSNLPRNVSGPLVLCHTLSAFEREEVIHTIRTEHSEARILIVGELDTAEQGDPFLFEVSDFAGTEALVAAARELVR